MKRLFLVATMVAALSGCAAQKFNHAVENANQVKNGMTVEQASAILGMAPNYREGVHGEYVQWRRGNAWRYTGLPSGAIEFHVVDGRIVEVPEGGIFSPAGVALVERRRAELAEQDARDLEELNRRRAAEAAEQAERARLLKEATDRQIAKDQLEREKAIAAEVDAMKNAMFVCRDKQTCIKAFALAQIYVQQNSDQKIQVATDTIIDTYNPTEGGRTGITVTKMPQGGTVEIIRIEPHCNVDDYFEKSCRMKRTIVYNGFRPFLEKSLVK